MLTKDNESDISKIVVDCIFKVHSTLGTGSLESAYEKCLLHEIEKRNLKTKSQKSIPIKYDDIHINAGFKIDILVENELIIELKAVDKMHPIYQAQIMTYLKLMDLSTGLLVNFNVKLIKDGIRRISI